MKLTIHPFKKGRPSTKKERGVALVTVMSILSVLTVLSIAIISLAGNELRSAKSYSDTVRTRQLSEMVTSMVIGQIREATRTDKKVGGGLFGGGALALWASQPGMIRTFEPKGGGTQEGFKLYSSTNMKVEDERDISLELESIRDWEQSPDRFVDLNAPSIAYNTKGQETNRFFPILDPRAKSLDKVEGFDFETFPGVQEEERLPMPVEWLYVLKDGTMGSLDPSGKFVSADPTAQPDTRNPITARIGFWTDDETCKINVNTAAEAVPWDKPKANTDLGKQWAVFQPVIREVQRYPGHPATTCLSSLFFPGKYVDGEGSRDKLSKGELQAILEITPKVEWDGGTEDGKKKGTTALQYDTDRLYASVDDIVFNIKREDNKFVDLLPDGLERFERAKGFMTVRSQGPELNVHGRPRISLWAFHENDSRRNRTALDDTIEFCTSLGPKNKLIKFFFQRRDATSRHAEFYSRANRSNVDLYMYLMAQVYKAVPSYGKSLATKYGAKKRSPFKPSYYKDKNEYKLDHFAIALQMFDYMRQVNIHDGNLAEPYADFQPGSNSGFGQISGINLIDRNLTGGTGSNVQSSSWQKKTLEPRGSGRMFTVSEVALLTYATATTTLKAWPPNGNWDGIISEAPNASINNGKAREFFRSDQGPGGDVSVIKRIVANRHPKYSEWRGESFGAGDVGKVMTYVETGMIPEAFAVAQGFHQIHPKQTIRLLTGGNGYDNGLDENGGLKLNGIPLQLWGDSVESAGKAQKGPAIYTLEAGAADVRSDLPAGWYGWGGAGGYRLFRFGRLELDEGQEGFHGRGFLANGTGPLSHFYCQTPVITVGEEDLILTQNNPVQLVIYDQGAEGASTGNLVQNINLRWAQPGEELVLDRPVKNSGEYSGWTRRFRAAAESSARVRPVFVLEKQENRENVTSLVVAHGDVRHVSTKRNVPSELFRLHPRVGKQRSSHSLSWAIYPKSTTLARHGTFSMKLSRRSLADVRYDNGDNSAMEPDFCWDPTREKNIDFAPLLGNGYDFPIDPSITRDFDNGIGGCVDGAYINKPDDGADDVPGSSVFNQKFPYFEAGEWKKGQSYEDRNLENFNPNRMVPSGVMFGSLPSASQANAPWTTLLFRPNVAINGHTKRGAHLGQAGNGMKLSGDKTTVDGFDSPEVSSVYDDEELPPDHIWLDFFWMPIVEPYPISEPFATSGKVNLNYQMLPFSYIKRATALAAIFKSERVLAIPNNAGQKYKKSESSGSPGWHHKIDVWETLEQWEHKFEQGKVFRTATEVCEAFLYPQNEDVSWDEDSKGIRKWWDKHRLTGDNSIEQPYANIYPRVTTKSNTFKVYMTVQTLQKVRGTSESEFVSGQDQVTGEYRGSAVIERFLDPTDRDIPNYKNEKIENKAKSLEQFYRYRVVNVRQFAH